MKVDKYFQKKGYSNKRFREIRSKVNRFLNENSGEGEQSSHLPHKQKRLGAIPSSRSDTKKSP